MLGSFSSFCFLSVNGYWTHRAMVAAMLERSARQFGHPCFKNLVFHSLVKVTIQPKRNESSKRASFLFNRSSTSFFLSISAGTITANVIKFWDLFFCNEKNRLRENIILSRGSEPPIKFNGHNLQMCKFTAPNVMSWNNLELLNLTSCYGICHLRRHL